MSESLHPPRIEPTPLPPDPEIDALFAEVQKKYAQPQEEDYGPPLPPNYAEPPPQPRAPRDTLPPYDWLQDNYVEIPPEDDIPSRMLIMSNDEVKAMQDAADKRRLKAAFIEPDRSIPARKAPEPPPLMLSPEDKQQRDIEALDTALAQAASPDLALQATEGDIARAMRVTRGVNVGTPEELRRALALVRSFDPDQEKTIQNISKELNIPIDVVRRDLPKWKETQIAQELWTVANELDENGALLNPITRKYVVDPHSVALVKDDARVLAQIENATYDAYPSLLNEAFLSAGRAVFDELPTAMGNAFIGLMNWAQSVGYEEYDEEGPTGMGKPEYIEPMAPISEKPKEAGFVYDLFSMTGQLAGVASTTIATSPIGGAAFMAAYIFGSSYEENISKGLAHEEAFTPSVVNATIQGAMEYLPISWIAKLYTTVGKPTRAVIKDAIVRSLESGGIETAQQFPDWFTRTWAESKAVGASPGEQREWFWEQITNWDNWKREFKEGTAQGRVAMVWAAILGIPAAFRTANIEAGTQQYLLDRRAAYDKMAERVQASRLKERDPETFERFNREVDSQAGLTTFYIDSDPWLTYAQTNPKDAKDAAKKLNIEGQLEEIRKHEGGDLSIDLAKWKAHVIGTPLEQAMLPHIRWSPEAESEAQIVEQQKQFQTLLQTHTKGIPDLESALREEPTPEIVKEIQKSVQALGFSREAAEYGVEIARRVMRGFYKARGETEAEGWNRIAAEFRRFKDRTELEAYLTEKAMPLPPKTAEGEEVLGALTRHEKGYLISILEKANLSTLLEEITHLTTTELNDLVKSGRATEVQKEAHEALRKAVGGKFDRKGMEAAAKMFLDYYQVGKAPSLALSRAFGYFGRALTRIYRKLGRQAKIDDFVKAALDTLHATQAEIDERVIVDRLQADWQTAVEAAKVPDELKAKVRQRRQDSANAAIARRVSRILRALYRERGGKKAMRDRIRQEMAIEPVYVAIEAVKAKGGIAKADFDAVAPGKFGEEILNKFPGVSKSKSTLAFDMALWDTPYWKNPTDFISALSVSLPVTQEVEKRMQSRLAEDIAAAKEQIRSGPMQGDDDFLTEERLELAVAEHSVMAEDARKEGERKQRKLSIEAMNREADAQIMRTEFSDALRTDRYIAAAKRYSKKALELHNAGKKDEALQAKKLELYHLALARRSAALREWHNAKLRFVVASQSVKTVQFEWQEQIRALSQRFGFPSTGPLAPEAHIPLGEWLDGEGLGADGMQVPIADWLIPEDNAVDYKTLKTADVYDIMDAIKSLRVSGTKYARTIHDGKVRDIDELAVRGGSFVAELPAKPVTDTHRKLLHSAQKTIRGLNAEVTSPQLIFRAMDGFPDVSKGLGFNERVLWGSISKAASAQSAAWRRLWPRIKNTVLPWATQFRKRIEEKHGKYFPTLNGVPLYINQEMAARAKQLGETNWDFEKLLAVVLNLGNPGNEDTLRFGHGWDEAQIEAIKSVLTESDWRGIREMVDIVESFADPMDKVHRRLKGLPTKKVVGRGFFVKTADDKYIHVDGWYYPIVIDTRFSDKIAEKAADQLTREEKSYRDAVTRYRGPRSQFAIERKGGKLAPLLKIDVFYRHLYDVIHFITHAEALNDVHNVTKRPAWKGQARRVFGDAMYDQVPKVIKDAARPDSRDTLRWSRTIERQRQLAILNLLSYNMRTLLVQPSAIVNPAADIGLKGMGKVAAQYPGMARDLITTAAAKLGVKLSQGDYKSLQFAYDSSQYLRDCLESPDRDVADSIARGFTHTKREIRLFGVTLSLRDVQEFGMRLIGMMDALTRVPTWLAAYKHGAETINLAHDDAVLYADAITSGSNPGPRPIDLSSAQRSNGIIRVATMFMGPGITFGSRTRYYWRGKRAGKISWGKFISHVLWEHVGANFLVTEALHVATTGEPADWTELGLGQIRWFFSFLPGISMMFDRREPNTPLFVGLRKMQAAGKNIADLLGDPTNEEEWKAFLLGVGELFDFQLGIPATRVTRTAYEGLQDLESGETTNPLRLFIRKDREH